MFRNIVVLTAFLMLMLTYFFIPEKALAVQYSDPFPQYSGISPNVDFWIKIYSRYDTGQGIIHDSNNLNIIYDVIELKRPDEPAANKINNKRTKRANDRIIRILKKLADDPNSKDPECMRVAALFGDDATSSDFRKAARQVRCQTGQKDRFLNGVVRSGAYLEQIREILHLYGLPEDLAYLPHVESSFDYNAYSKFGAAGIWQFTRSTGKRYMKIGYVLDERRDPLAATHAAALLLKRNYNILGNWPLAITAYNHGTFGMQKAKKRYGTYEKIVEQYRGRTFGFASRNFYSEFLAARIIAKDPEQYFGTIMVDTPLRFQTLHLEGYTAFSELSNHFGVSESVLKDLNPALRKPVIDGQKYIPKGYEIRLPIKTEDKFITPLAGIDPALYKSQQRPSRFHTVQRGDTAGKIARLHGVKLSDLILANNLNRRAVIYPRQTLRIPLGKEILSKPVVKKEQPVVETAQIEKTEMKKLPEIQLVSTSPSEQPIPKGKILSEEFAEPSSIEIPEQPDRDFDELHMSEDEKKSINSAIVTADIQVIKTYVQDGLPIGIIQVEVEETLGHYADWLKIPTWELRRLNDISYGSVLHLHQEIKLPLRKVSVDEFEERRYEYYKRLQEDFFTRYRIESLKPYRVKNGDSFWTICRDRFDIPLWLLKQCNPDVDFSALRVHQDLIIPAVVSS